MKKFLAMTLAVVMALSFSVTAFATDTNLPSTSGINVPVTIKAPVIKVTINDAGAITVNPYHLTVDMSGSEVTSGIVSTAALITNNGDSNVKITATPTLTETNGSNVTVLSSASESSSQTGKWIYLFMELVNLSSNDTSSATWKSDVSGNGACVVSTGGENSATLVLDKMQNSTSTYGAMGFGGDSGDNGTTVWSANDDAMTLTVIFDVAPTNENASTT